jgi:MFS family permease
VLVLARAVQGVGAGAIPAIAYTSIGRSFPESLRPRMFAVLSTAWVVPGLIGPAASGLVADHIGWRWVFLGLLPLVALAASIAIPALRRIGPPATPTAATGLRDAALVALGAGLLIAGLSSGVLLLLPVLVAGGIVIGLPPLRRLMPPGTLQAEPGLPATILIRGVLTFAFFGADSYVPLTITDVRDHSTTIAGLALTATTLTWTAGAWVQARVGPTWGAPRSVRRGMALVAVGIVGMLLVDLTPAPLALLLVLWALGGLGMGLAYPTISVTVLREAPEGREGSTSASLQLADTLGVALGAGLGGAAVAAGEVLDWPPETGLAVAFALALAAALTGILLARRVPEAAAVQTGR